MIKNTIREAILQKKAMRIFAQGHMREVCPHVLGTKDGGPQALFFQYAGGSKSRLPPGGDWRCIPLADIRSAEIIEGAEWRMGNRHTRRQTCVDRIDVQVDV